MAALVIAATAACNASSTRSLGTSPGSDSLPPSSSSSSSDAALRSSLTFKYTRIGAPGFIDSTVAIGNSGQRAVAPTLSFEALDASGEVITDAGISTAFGSDVGNVVVPPGGGAIDVLAFAQAVVPRVQNVRVTIVRADPADMPAARSSVNVQALGPDGQPVDKSASFASIVLTNTNDVAVVVRVVVLTYDQPAQGEPQQVTAALAIAGPVEVPAAAKKTIQLGEAVPALSGFARSVKTYFSR